MHPKLINTRNENDKMQRNKIYTREIKMYEEKEIT
jgi:hypothetical protein